MGITSHVLDLSSGRPAEGVEVVLHVAEASGGWTELARSRTDPDGRIADLLAAPVERGTYRLSFATGAYFAARDVDCFHPAVYVSFTVTAGAEHHHVPLLLSPFGYSTYRGS